MKMQDKKMKKMGSGKKKYHDDICDMDFATKKEFEAHMKKYKEYHEKMGGKIDKW